MLSRSKIKFMLLVFSKILNKVFVNYEIFESKYAEVVAFNKRKHPYICISE